MRTYNIDYFLEKEKTGVIFGKISKNEKCNNILGANYSYKAKIGEVIKAKEQGAKNNYLGFTIEPLELALLYLHYGNQLTIVNFTKLANKINPKEFNAFDGSKSGCFEVNYLYIETVLDFKDVSTMKYMIDNVSDEIIINNSRNVISHLREQGNNEAADYLNDYCIKYLKNS